MIVCFWIILYLYYFVIFWEVLKQTLVMILLGVPKFLNSGDLLIQRPTLGWPGWSTKARGRWGGVGEDRSLCAEGEHFCF